MKIEDLIKIIKAMKPSQCNLIGGSLITAGIAGTSSPFWFPLIEDLTRTTFNLAMNTEEYTASNTMIVFSAFLIILGVGLIALNRVLEHKESIVTNHNNIVSFPPRDESSAFEATTGGKVVINGGKVKNYEKVAKASSNGVVSITDTIVEKNNE